MFGSRPISGPVGAARTTAGHQLLRMLHETVVDAARHNVVRTEQDDDDEDDRNKQADHTQRQVGQFRTARALKYNLMPLRSVALIY